MNFCTQCGADLRSNPNAKFCYNCGNQLDISDNLNTNHIENVDVVKTDINPDDDFNYFDFPERKYFREYMLEVIEHVQSNPNLSNDDIAKKYFEKGEDLFEARTIYYNVFRRFGGGNIQALFDIEYDQAEEDYYMYLIDNRDNFIKSIFEKVVNFYEASLYFAKCEETYYQLFVCYQYGKEYEKAHENLILYAETCKEKFGLNDSRTIQASEFCIDNFCNGNVELNLPDWMNRPL